MKRVSRAYAVLSDPERRQRYDATLAGMASKQLRRAVVNRTVGRWRARALITHRMADLRLRGTGGDRLVRQPAAANRCSLPGDAAPVDADRQLEPPPASIPRRARSRTTASSSPDLDALRSDLAAAKVERDRALEQTILQAKELDFLSGRILSAPGAAHGPSRFSGVWVLPPSRTAHPLPHSLPNRWT